MKQLQLLNRVVTWNGSKGFICEADPRHVEIIVKQFELEQSKAVILFCAKDEGRTTTAMEEPLPTEEASKYRALVARYNHLGPDRLDIVFSAKELVRQMSAPTVGDWTRLKRFGRYSQGRPRFQETYGWQEIPTVV